MATGSALVIGEALVDIVRHPNGDTFEAPGGSPLNVAVTLARLGVDTSLLTALSNDSRTDMVVDHAVRSGVRLVDGARRLPRTSSAAATLQANGAADYTFDLAWNPTPESGPPAQVVHAGSVALFLEPGASLVRRRLEERSGTAMISLDPNIRPALSPDLGLVRLRFEQLVPFANVVKLSDEDVASLYPDVTKRHAVRLLLDAGPTLVVLTQGARGCTLASGEMEVTLPAVRSEVVDTIGAGDSYMGGLLWQILKRDLVGGLKAGQSLNAEDLTALGAAAADVAAVTVSRAGANPPWLSELRQTH